MRCISLWQPHATLWVAGRDGGPGPKRYETRHWRMPFKPGEVIAVHAAKRWNPEMAALALSEPFRSTLSCLGYPGERTLYRGGIVGLVQIGGTREMTPDLIAQQTPAERAFGFWEAGRFATEATKARELPDPIPLRGQQGVWTLPHDVIRAVFAQYKKAVNQ